MIIRSNFHTHTTFCDGKSAPEDIVLRALELGFERLGFSGHVDIDPVMDLPAYVAEIRRLAAKYAGQIEILCGGELDNLYPRRRLEELDYVIGSTHHAQVGLEKPMAYDLSEEELLRLLNEGYGGDAFRMAKDYYRTVAGTYDDTGCAFIGHFDLVTRFNPSLGYLDEADPRYLAPACEAMEYLVSEGVPFEINTGKSHLGKLYPGPLLLQRLHDLGGEILINSDAHRAGDLDKGFDMAVAAAKACGFDHVNALTKRRGRLEYVQTGI